MKVSRQRATWGFGSEISWVTWGTGDAHWTCTINAGFYGSLRTVRSGGIRDILKAQGRHRERKDQWLPIVWSRIASPLSWTPGQIVFKRISKIESAKVGVNSFPSFTYTHLCKLNENYCNQWIKLKSVAKSEINTDWKLRLSFCLTNNINW